MTLPNFLVIGAAKAGTTALYAYLKQHPQIYMSPVKETNFFAFEGEKPSFIGVKPNPSSQSYQREFKTDIESYRQQFQGATEEIAIGEACPSYLYIPKAAERIKYYIPEVKLIAILRDPIERAYSNFLHHVRDRTEHCENFIEAIEAESWRIQKDWWWGFHYVQVSLYFEQLKKYFELFDRNQIKVYLYEDLKNSPESFLHNICQFLEVEPALMPDMSAKHNSTGVPTNKFLDNLIKGSNPVKSVYQMLLPSKSIRQKLTAKVSQLNPLVKPSLTPEMRKQLLSVFHADILKLQELIEQDLSSWLV